MHSKPEAQFATTVVAYRTRSMTIKMDTHEVKDEVCGSVSLSDGTEPSITSSNAASPTGRERLVFGRGSAHRATEQRRRQVIKDTIGMLRRVVPSEGNPQDRKTKAKILEEAVDYIKQLQYNVHILKHKLKEKEESTAMLFDTNARLLEQIDVVQRENERLQALHANASQFYAECYPQQQQMQQQPLPQQQQQRQEDLPSPRPARRDRLQLPALTTNVRTAPSTPTTTTLTPTGYPIALPSPHMMAMTPMTPLSPSGLFLPSPHPPHYDGHDDSMDMEQGN